MVFGFGVKQCGICYCRLYRSLYGDQRCVGCSRCGLCKEGLLRVKGDVPYGCHVIGGFDES